MRFLADENFPGLAVAALQSAGHDVVWIRTTEPGASDSDVLARAVRERRIVLTFDKDFGELAGRSPLPTDCGVVLFRTTATRPDALAAVLLSRSDWPDHFSVVEPNRVRMRRFR